MKRPAMFIALAMTFVLISCGGSANRQMLEIAERQNWEGAKLSGSISRITETTYELAAVYGRKIKTELLSQKFTDFNERGDVVLSEEYDIDSMLLEKVK